MFRRYIIITKQTGIPIFNMRRFWSVNGATKFIIRNYPTWYIGQLEIRKFRKFRFTK
jgi:hypothetical protein